MDLELVNFINSDLTWNAVKKGHRTMARRPRRVRASNSSEFGFNARNKTQDTVVFDYEKSGVAILGQHFAEVLDVPIKKRILLLQPPDQGARSPEQLVKSCNGSSNNEHLKQIEKEVLDLNCFSGIELLAAAACHSAIYDISGNMEEHTPPKVDSYTDDVKGDIAPMVSDNSSAQNCEGDKSPVPSMGVRLHWDLNTVMDEWEEEEEPCCDVLVDRQSEKSSTKDVFNDDKISVLPLINPDIFSIQENDNGGSDVVDSVLYPAKCENVSTSTASVSLEKTTIKIESLNKSDDGQAVSEVVQGCHMIDGNTIDKVKSGYDSPVEDGELREPTRFSWEKNEIEERECVDYESDNIYEDNFDTIESVKNEITIENLQKTIIEQGDKADTSDKPDHPEHSQSVILEEKNASSAKFLPERKSVHDEFPDRSTTFGVRRNGDCVHRSRSDNIGDYYSRADRDFGQEKFMGRDGQWVDSSKWDSRNNRGYLRPENDQSISYNPKGNYREFNTRPSPSDKNQAYGIHRGTLPARRISGDRSRGGSGLHTQGFRRVPKKEHNYPEPHNSNRGDDLSRSRRRSRSRSRSGSPIAWNFQKKRNVDTQKQSPDRFSYRKVVSSGDMEASRSFDDRNIINGQYRDRRQSPVGTFHRDQRFETGGYLGRSKSNDNFRPIPRPPRFPQANNDEKYGMMNGGRRSRYDVDESFKTRYPRNKDNTLRYVRNENRGFRDPIGRDIPENTS